MTHYKHVKLTFICIFLCSCATPKELKQLSTKQLEYLDVAVEVVEKQSNALILASEKLANIAISNIERNIENNTDGTVKDVLDAIASNSVTEDELNELLKEFSNTTKNAIINILKIESDLEKIRDTSNEIAGFIEQLKKIQIVIDAYMQSEKAGEAVLNDIFKLPAVGNIFEEIHNRMQVLQSSQNNILSIIHNLNEER